MGLYSETSWKKSTAVIVLSAAFLVIYLPWVFGNRELFRDESLYAVETVEYGKNLFQVTAHGVPVYSNAPLFPAASSLVWKVTGLPVEVIMRGISMLMLAAGAVLVYFAAASQREPRAGWVAAAFYLTPLIALEKAVEGNPATMAAFFLSAPGFQEYRSSPPTKYSRKTHNPPPCQSGSNNGTTPHTYRRKPGFAPFLRRKSRTIFPGRPPEDSTPSFQSIGYKKALSAFFQGIAR